MNLFRWINFRRRGIRVWRFCNISPEANIGNGVSIGAYTEIGPRVEIGRNSRIGAKCFIPEGVTIGENVFVGPATVFSNDMYPPSPKPMWRKTRVRDGASIGAGARIVPGIEIGEEALVGMGAVVTQDIPPGEVWAGVPARELSGKKREGEKCLFQPTKA